MNTISQPGLVESECKFAKTDPEVIERIAKERNAPVDLVRKACRYNMWTIAQFAFLTGLKEYSIFNYLRPAIIKGETVTRLDYCYPFPDNDGTGPKFILRNEKSEKFLVPDPKRKPEKQTK